MKILYTALLPGALILATSAAAEDRLSPGIWTNTEDQYFAEEELREKPEWLGFQIGEDKRWQQIDPFGTAISEWQDGTIPGISERDGGGWNVGTSELRKARPLSCWVSVKKFAASPDGTADWTFASKLASFDQGGRVFVSGNDVAPDVTFRIRNVTWAKGSRNKPSLVLYVHKDDPARAESYAWSAPDAAMIGINLRWVQGSCSLVSESE